MRCSLLDRLFPSPRTCDDGDNGLLASEVLGASPIEGVCLLSIFPGIEENDLRGIEPRLEGVIGHAGNTGSRRWWRGFPADRDFFGGPGLAFEDAFGEPLTPVKKRRTA